MAAAQTPQAPVVGVLGASGGLGASTLATALAVTAARRESTVTVVVDGVTSGSGGLDVTACVEHAPGLRWADLARARGDIDGAALLGQLPAVGGAGVLSAGPPGHEPPGPPVVSRVVAALRVATRMVVLDLPRCGASLECAAFPGRGPAPGPGRPESLVAHCDAVVLLGGTAARQLADVAVTAAAVGQVCPDVCLVVRGAPRGSGLPESLAAQLDLPLLGRWHDDRRIRADADRGRTPGERRRSALSALCARVLDALPRPAGVAPPAGAAERGILRHEVDR